MSLDLTVETVLSGTNNGPIPSGLPEAIVNGLVEIYGREMRRQVEDSLEELEGLLRGDGSLLPMDYIETLYQQYGSPSRHALIDFLQSLVVPNRQTLLLTVYQELGAGHTPSDVLETIKRAVLTDRVRLLSTIPRAARIRDLFLHDRDDLARQRSLVRDNQIGSLPRELVRRLRGLAVDAINAAADGLQATKERGETDIEKVESDPSLNNPDGSVDFTLQNGRLSITPDSPTEDIEAYGDLLQSTLDRLCGPELLNSASNSAPELFQLLAEYKEELNKNTPPLGEQLWLRGLRVQQVLQFAEANRNDPEYPPLARNLERLLSEFVTTHNLYVWCFPRVRKLIRDLEQSQTGLRPLGERQSSVQSAVLVALADRAEMYDDRSQRIMSLAADTNRIAPGDVPPRGQEAINLGLIRGSLQRISHVCLQALRFARNESVGGLISAGAVFVATNATFYNMALSFFSDSRDLLLKLATEMPIYFRWLQSLLALLL